MNTTGGNATVGLSGIAGRRGRLQITSETNEYGSVQVGTTATKTFTSPTRGGTNVTITKSKPPSRRSVRRDQLAPGGHHDRAGARRSPRRSTFTPDVARLRRWYLADQRR